MYRYLNKYFDYRTLYILSGILAGYSVSNKFWLLLMPISIVTLWSIASNPFLGFIWGFFAIAVSHSWLLSLHPINVIQNNIISFLMTYLIWFLSSLFGALLILIWCYVVKAIQLNNDSPNISIREIGCVIFTSSIWSLGEYYLSKTPLFWIGLGDSIIPGDIYFAGLASFIGSSGIKGRRVRAEVRTIFSFACRLG